MLPTLAAMGLSHEAASQCTTAVDTPRPTRVTIQNGTASRQIASGPSLRQIHLRLNAYEGIQAHETATTLLHPSDCPATCTNSTSTTWATSTPLADTQQYLKCFDRETRRNAFDARHIAVRYGHLFE